VIRGKHHFRSHTTNKLFLQSSAVRGWQIPHERRVFQKRNIIQGYFSQIGVGSVSRAYLSQQQLHLVVDIEDRVVAVGLHVSEFRFQGSLATQVLRKLGAEIGKVDKLIKVVDVLSSALNERGDVAGLGEGKQLIK